MTDDWEFSEDDCPKCQSQLAQRQCMGCGGTGYTEGKSPPPNPKRIMEGVLR